MNRLLEILWIFLTRKLVTYWETQGRRAGKKAFFCILRSFVTVSVEVIPVRKSSQGEWEILFLKRGADPIPEFSGRLHTPGVKLLFPGETLEQTVNRVCKDELGCKGIILEKSGWSIVESPRDTEVLLLVLVNVPDNLSQGQWVPITAIAGMVEQDQIIKVQYTGFLKQIIDNLLKKSSR